MQKKQTGDYEVGQRIKAKRKQLKMTQLDLSNKIGYEDRSSIAHIEKGDKDFSRKTLIDIANALNVSPIYLLLGYEETYTFDKVISILTPEDKAKISERLHTILEEKRYDNIPNIERIRNGNW